jgi:hypothetical protein
MPWLYGGAKCNRLIVKGLQKTTTPHPVAWRQADTGPKKDLVMRSPKAKLRPTFRDAMVTWLNGMEWTFFATLTTPYEMNLRNARSLAERTNRSWSLMADGQCRFLWVAERNQLRDGHHLHALVKVPDNFTHPHLHAALCEAYQAMAGGKVETIDRATGKTKYRQWARIDLRRFDKRRNASGYLSKYMTKANELLDWDIYGNA